MKRILLPVFMFFAVVFAGAQTVMTFSKEQAQFPKDLSYFMTANKNEQSIAAMNAFDKMVKEGKIPAAWYEKMAKVCNTMAERGMYATAHFVPYLEAVMSAAKSTVPDNRFVEWSDFVVDVIDAQKKGDNSGFLKTMDFSVAFFSEGGLFITPQKTWKVDTREARFVSEGLRPYVSFPQTTFRGIGKGDSIAITLTSGEYYPLETRWEGKSGRVDWSRAGMDANKVYCTFKSYAVNCSNISYTIDTVTFYNSEYFKTPLTGKLIDKITSSGDSSEISYPRFESYDFGITMKDVAPNVNYVGGFSLHGVKVLGYGNAEEDAMLNFYSRDGKTKVMTVKSPTVRIKRGEELGAEKAEVSIYFAQDSIYHPSINVVYKAAKREVRLIRNETGLGKAKFTDSYHKHEFQTDAIFWNLDSSILNLKILSGVSQKPDVFESANYFNKEVIRKMQGYVSYEPLSAMKKLSEKNGTREISAMELATTLNASLKEDEIKALLYLLVENGFINYDEGTGIVTVKDKTFSYVAANAKKIDYDIIRITSLPKAGNDFIDLKNNNIDLKGVLEVPISDTAYVYFRPKNNAISIQQDRNMEFDGMIYAGRTDLTGQKYKFNYKPFTVDLTKVDTMVLYIPDSANTLDQYGNPVLVPMKSRIENITGLLEIDAPINKSGRTRLLQFPKLQSKEKSNIYYDDPAIAKGAYTRKNFFFELEPFRLDSMGIFSPGMVNWPGKLASGGIFPDIKDRISIQKDLSLGFKSETPPDGYPLYGGKGQYYGKFELNYSGLQGDGRITHSTADFTTHDVRLYPDSMRATTDTFTITKTFEGVQTPAVVGTSDMIFWKPATDSMLISMLDKAKPFSMYDDGFTTFKGNLLLTNKGLRGDGTLDWAEATLTSKDFSFRTMALSADTAALNIKTTGDRVTFKTPNVSAKVDFETRIGHFVANEKNIPTEFSYNKYTTAINEFKWFMDEKILDFKAPPQGPGEYFTSTKAEQKGLKFLGKRATYSLVTSILRVEQVPEIRVADASVIPDSGVVIIEEDAKMNQLKNATIIADTIHKYHKIEKATVDIYSKEQLGAVGEYKYVTKDSTEIIQFTDISCKKETEGKRKNQRDMWMLTSKASLNADRNFIIYPNVLFNGEVNLLSVNPFLNFKGYSKIVFTHPKAPASDFFINQDIDPNRLALEFDTTTKNSNNNKLTAGIHLNPEPGASGMYSTLLTPKLENKDITLFRSTGVIVENGPGEYAFGDTAKINRKALTGNVLTYNDKKGTVKAEGNFSLGTNFGIIKTLSAGSAEAKLDSNIYRFNLSFGMDFNMDAKMQERFEFYMTGDNADQADISYESEKQKKAVNELCDAKDDKKLLDEFAAVPVFNKRPKGLDHNVVFSDVNFVYDPEDVSLRSVGKIGVAMIGKKVINKKVDGYIEFQYKGGLDIFTIYLQTGTKDWFFFEYRPGSLGIVSSYDDMNKLLGAIPPDKRKIKGEKDKFYYFTLGSTLNKADFTEYMKDKAAGVVRVRPEPRIELPPVFEEDTTLVDSLGQISPDQQQKMQQQKEINEMERMKMSNESILSGPPPDRKKKKNKEEEAQPSEEEIQIQQKAAEQRQREQEEFERMKMSGGNQSIFSAPPPDRTKPKEEAPKEELKQEEVPVEQVPVQQEEPAKEIPVEEAPQEVPVEQPKSETPPVETPVQEIQKEEPKIDTPVMEVPQEEPKTETPVQETPVEQPKSETPPVEMPAQEVPKEEPEVETPAEKAPGEVPAIEAPVYTPTPVDTVPK